MLRSFARTGHWDGIEAARSNYHTLTGQRVLKVNFNNKKASGVSFVPAEATSAANALTVRAKKEVIMAAGTIHTPKILQASGIGAKALLQAANIPRVVDLPGVGANLNVSPPFPSPEHSLTVKSRTSQGQPRTPSFHPLITTTRPLSTTAASSRPRFPW